MAKTETTGPVDRFAYAWGNAKTWGLFAGLGTLAFGLIAGITAAPTLAVLGLIPAGAWLIGAMRGWNQAATINGEFKEMKIERDEARSAAMAMAQELNGAAPRRFTDTIQSRGARGSYADAVDADRASLAQNNGRA